MDNPFDNKDEHDRYLRKNLALSRAYDIDRKDKIKAKQTRGEIKHTVTKCHKCKEEKPCMPHQIMQTGTFEGAASVSKELVFFCDDCSPEKKKKDMSMSKKQIKALLRGAKKGRL